MKLLQLIFQVLNFYLISCHLYLKRVLFISFLGFPLLLSAATTSVTNSTSNAISDNTCFDRTFNVTTANASINSVTISVDITHTYRGDLSLTLTSPQGTSVDLTSNNGGSVDDLKVLFDDSASTSITSDTTTHTSQVTRKPEGTLSTFNNQTPFGIWTLQICDSASQDQGTYNTSTLNIDYTPLNTPPTANAGADQTVSQGSIITFDGSGSSDSDGSIVSYDWSYNGTTIATGVNGTYDTAANNLAVGTYNVLLTVTDDAGATATDNMTITVVGNLPPTANAGADQLINLGDNTSLDASGSSDSDGSIVSYLWKEGATTLSTSVNFTLASLSAGIHTITLTVTDDDGATDSDSVEIKVNTAPVANAGPDQNVSLGDPITLDGSASTDDFNAITYTWTEGSVPVNATGVSPTINIPTAGTYTITLTVTDDNGLTDTDTVVIHVNTPPVTQDMNFTILQNTSVSFELNATDADGDTMVSFPIFTSPSNGGLSGPDTNITYTPNLDYLGTDFLTYKAYDGIDYSNESTVTFTIVPPATAVQDDYNTTYYTPFTGNVLDNDLGLNITLIDFNTTSHGSLNINSDGEFNYTPDFEWDGNDTFTYTIKDDFNLTSTTTVYITVFPPRSDLSISKSAPASIDAGFAMDYTLDIASTAGEQYLNAENVRVIDTLPTGVLYSGVTAPSGWTCGYLGATLTCDASTIAPGYSGTITIHVFAPNNLGDSTNTATITSDMIDPDQSNNSSSATTTITGADVDLSISKTVSSPTVTTTDSFTYTIAVQNSGTANTSNVVVNDVLDASLGFISVDSGIDWVCSQGSTVSCSYIANGGVFTAGNTSNNIVITVRAPSAEANITNTAFVTSDALELDTTNNSASVDVNITNGVIQTQGTPLVKYLQYNLFGDISLIGNANINWDGNTIAAGAANPPLYNDNANMLFVDTDNDPATFNSSSAAFSDNYPVVWAGLYWEGHICDITNPANNTFTNNTLGCIYNNLPANINTYATAMNQLETIQFQVPGAGYQTLQAHTVNTIVNTTNIFFTNQTLAYTRTDLTYSAFRDVTNLVQTNGVFSVANIVSTEGITTNGGNYGGWTMLVIYEDQNQTLNYKNISVFNGFQQIATDGNIINIAGFLTPLSGTINASVAFFAGDGDPGAGGIGEMQDANNNNTFVQLTDALNPTGNLLNSTIGSLGVDINNIGRTYGVDADRIDVSTFLTNSQSQTSFRFGVTDPNNAAQEDHYTLSMFAFATDLTTPIIDNFEKSAVIIDVDGTRRIAEPNAVIYPGSSIEYTLTFKNTGDEVAEAVEIFDDFDFDGLTRALDIDNFDTTQIKLFDGDNTTNLIANPDCGYDVGDRRVYCKIDSIAIDASYTMQFVVRVKDILDSDIFTTPAENTAYAKYRNPNGDIYVARTTTPDGESVGGKSNSLNAGVFAESSSFTDAFISLDAINEHYPYNTDKNITTKIVNQPFNLQVVHLDRSEVYSAYQAWRGSYIMPVIITLEKDGDTSVNISTQPRTLLNNPATTYFSQGVSEIIVRNLNLAQAHRNDKIKLAYLDWNAILGAAPSTSPCVTNEDFSTNLNGLPACFNSYALVKEIFPANALPELAVCYGQGDVPVAQNFPCDPLAYSTGGDIANGFITPAAYNHSYGCYQCITQAHSAFRRDSTDEFAARPKYFELTSEHPSFPDLLRSGVDYNLSLIAYDGQITPQPTLGYTTDGATLNIGSTSVYAKGTTTPSPTLEGIAELNATNAGQIVDGVSGESIPFTFNNVGRIFAEIMDEEWANVDLDTPSDCNETLPVKYGFPIEARRAICGGVDATFIPHHFKVTTSLKNHRNTTFTYISNDLDMSAGVEVKIEAKNAADATTTNFIETGYENPISVGLSVSDWNATIIDNKPTPRLDTDLHTDDIPSPISLGFKDTDKGEYTIGTTSATPEGQRIRFNYARDRATPKNPFVIDGSEVNTTILSTYTSTQGAVEGSADIKGTDLADQNATFVYGMVKASQDFYSNITGATRVTPVMVKVYCDEWPATAAQCPGIDVLNGVTIENRWWLSWTHDETLGDGNITLTSPPTIVSGGAGNNPTVTTDVNVTAEGTDDTIVLSRGGNDVPMTVRVDLDTTNSTDTNSWLLPPTDELFGGNFVGNSGWTGRGETGNVVDSNASKQIHRRLGW